MHKITDDRKWQETEKDPEREREKYREKKTERCVWKQCTAREDQDKRKEAVNQPTTTDMGYFVQN